MTRECQVRICERLGGKFPGPTRPPRRIAAVRSFGRDRSEADMPRASGAGRSDENDPKQALAGLGGIHLDLRNSASFGLPAWSQTARLKRGIVPPLHGYDPRGRVTWRS